MSKKYGADEFLGLFADADIRRQVTALFPEVDFAPGSADAVEPDIITELEISAADPRVLAGLEVFTNLKIFRLDDSLAAEKNHYVTGEDWDWRVPATWTQLESLTVNGGSMQGLYFPEDLTTLKEVSITGKKVIRSWPPPDAGWIPENYPQNSIETLHFPQQTPKLTEIKIDHCLLFDLRLPEDAPWLFRINIGHREKPGCGYPSSLEKYPNGEDLFIENFPWLWHLELRHCDFRRVVLSHLPLIGSLYSFGDAVFEYVYMREFLLYDMPILNILEVPNGDLEYIRLPGADDDPGAQSIVEDGLRRPISRVMPAACNSLACLDLSYNRFKSLSFPKHMAVLSDLRLSGNKLKELELPPELPREIDLENNLLTSFKIMTDQPRLEILRLGNNRFTEFELAGRLPRLAKLNLQENNITKLALPADFPELRELNIRHNPIAVLPPCQMPNLRVLNALYTDIVSWKDLPVSHPEVLTSLSAQVNANAEFAEIEARFPNLETLCPFIEKDLDLRLLFGKWGRYDSEYCKYYSYKTVYVPNLPFKATCEGSGRVSFPLGSLPGLRFLQSKAFKMVNGYYTEINRNTKRLTIKEYTSEYNYLAQDRYGYVLPELFFVAPAWFRVEMGDEDYFDYAFKAFAPELGYDNWYDDEEDYGRGYKPVRLNVEKGRLVLSFWGPVVSRTRGRVEIDGLVFFAKDGAWPDNGYDAVSWPLPQNYDCLGKTAVVRGFYDENWVKITKKRLVVGLDKESY